MVAMVAQANYMLIKNISVSTISHSNMFYYCTICTFDHNNGNGDNIHRNQQYRIYNFFLTCFVATGARF